MEQINNTSSEVADNLNTLEVQSKFIKGLRDDRKWYTWRRRALQAVWILLSLAGLVLGFLASLLIALDWPHANQPYEKLILVVIPAVGGFCSTLLVHFRLRDSWELREVGRIDIDELIVRAWHLPIYDHKNFREELLRLQLKRIEISRQQTTRTFLLLAQNAEAKNPKEDVAESKPTR